MKNYDRLCEKAIESLMGDGTDVDEKYIVSSRQSFTKRELADEMRNRTDIGLSFIDNLLLLSVDLFDRQKEKLKDFDRI